jgi:hypothetical protein
VQHRGLENVLPIIELLERLATDRSVIFYDQLGCGKPDQPNDRSLWKIERLVAEVNTVALKIPT